AQIVVERHGGRFPATEQALRALPGIGAYTAAAIAAIAFGRHATPIDGNVERVVARLFAVAEELPAAKPRIRALAGCLTPASRTGDFAQAMMDLGATICTPKRPACGICPWSIACRGSQLGIAESFPRKTPKPPGRLRRGAGFWVVRADGSVLVRTRPSGGLLGGMTEVPTSKCSHDFETDRALAQAPLLPSAAGAREQPTWRRLPGKVTHTFTHFPLELTVFAAEAAADMPPPPDTRWVPLARLGEEPLPTLMRKVVAHAVAAGGSS
ncbi:MAG TPA: NUDIX domain-containing protein, partial [Xanthobacteraceae bacterium]|nr:NUDIX domain-containing protein [Xanthobacteraceae bacterium]